MLEIQGKAGRVTRHPDIKFNIIYIMRTNVTVRKNCGIPATHLLFTDGSLASLLTCTDPTVCRVRVAR